MKRKLPKTDSIQELAKFWDSHDLTDCEEELEEVAEPVFERKRKVTVHLEEDEAQRLHRLAKSRGVPDSELIHEWVRERIRAT